MWSKSKCLSQLPSRYMTGMTKESKLKHKKRKFLVPAKYKPGMPTTILMFSVNTITMLYVYYCLSSGEGQWGSACGKYLWWQSFVILIVSVIECSSWWCLSRHQCEIWIKHTLIFPTCHWQHSAFSDVTGRLVSTMSSKGCFIFFNFTLLNTVFPRHKRYLILVLETHLSSPNVPDSVSKQLTSKSRYLQQVQTSHFSLLQIKKSPQPS